MRLVPIPQSIRHCDNVEKATFYIVKTYGFLYLAAWPSQQNVTRLFSLGQQKTLLSASPSVNESLPAYWALINKTTLGKFP